MRRFVKLIAIATALQMPIAMPAFSQTQNRNIGYGVYGRIIVPIPNFQEMFEVLLVQNLEQVVQATVADSQGRYRFTGLARGTYFVVVKLEGFQEVRQRVDLATDSIVNVILDFQEERVVKAPTDFSGEEVDVVDVAEISKTYPAHIVTVLNAADKDLRSGNYARALPALDQLVREVPDLYDAHRLLGMIYQKLRRYRDAESEFKTTAELRRIAAPLINLGSLYVEEAEAA
jgi:tetratricopeptide (TPR) repeat protein